MPWTTANVDHHKRGLSPAQKRRWVAVANAVLRRCQKRKAEPAGGCDALAIRVANAAMKSK